MDTIPVPELANGLIGASSEKRGFGAALLCFVLLAAVALGLIGKDLRPRPLYYYQFKDGGYATCAAGSPLLVTLRLPEEKRVSSVIFYAVLPASFPLVATAVDLSNGRQIATKTYATSGMLELPLPAASEVRVLGLRFQSEARDPNNAPRLALSRADSPNWKFKMQPSLQKPLFLNVQFDWPTRNLLWIWVLLAPVFWMAWRLPKLCPAYLVVLGLCCMISSTMLWQQEYSLEYEKYDADKYAGCAEAISCYFVHPEMREEARQFLDSYCRASNSLGSALISIFLVFDVPLEPACLFFSALCGFGALLAFLRILGHLRVSSRVRLVALTIFALHWLQIRSFCTVISDEFGLFLVAIVLCLLMNRVKAVRRHDPFSIGALLFALPLARPPGLVFAVFLLFGIVACDAWREKKIAPGRRIRTALCLAWVPLLLLTAVFVEFHWGARYVQQMKEIQTFGLKIPKRMLIPVVIGVFQWFPLIWICGKNTLWKNNAAAILIGWLAFYILLLVVGKAPVMSRHFLPVLPALAGLSAYALENFRKGWGILGWGLVWMALIANAGAVFYHLFALEMDPFITPFITSW